MSEQREYVRDGASNSCQTQKLILVIEKAVNNYGNKSRILIECSLCRTETRIMKNKVRAIR